MRVIPRNVSEKPNVPLFISMLRTPLGHPRVFPGLAFFKKTSLCPDADFNISCTKRNKTNFPE